MEDRDNGHRRAGQADNGSADHAAGDGAGGPADATPGAVHGTEYTGASEAAGEDTGLTPHSTQEMTPEEFAARVAAAQDQAVAQVFATGRYTVTVPTMYRHVLWVGANKIGGGGGGGVSVTAHEVEHEGVRVGEIEGWRCWRIVGDLLMSVAMNDVWTPGTVMEGKPEEYEGVHAWKTRAQAYDYAHGAGLYVIGKVALWGEVIEHEHGYRAQYAKPLELATVIDKEGAPQKDLLHDLRLVYGMGDDGWKPRRFSVVLSIGQGAAFGVLMVALAFNILSGVYNVGSILKWWH